MHERILIIDDNVKWCKSLAQNFEQRGYTPSYATTGEEALGMIAAQTIHVVLLDIMLGRENGLNVLKDILSLDRHLPVIMITGFGSIDTAVQAMKTGAFDYVTKPLDIENLLKLIEHALKRSLRQGNLAGETPEGMPRLITRNPAMLALCEQARKFAETDLPILITGENGTGKEIIADFIHAHSSRSDRKMLKINCAAFPESLLDNELFGHEKGAYTGAETSFKGVFERAHQSSLFLDEIGDMPATIQAKILRTLQNHEIRRIGGDRVVTIDVRFIAATNKELRTLIAEHHFREDLFYRLDVATLHVPPLRDRKEDIPLLADYFLNDYASAHTTRARQISPSVLARFADHRWSGNVRELKNTIHFAAAIASTDTIDLDALPPRFRAMHEPDSPAVSVPNHNVREDMERNLILATLQQTHYNKKKTAELLNMSRNTLYHKIEKYGIAFPQ